MKRKFHLTSVSIFVLCLVMGTARAIDYSEVDRFGNGCPRLESCAHQRETRGRELASFRDHNCACDHLCAEYGDCCIDAPGRRNQTDGQPVKCLELKQFGGVYMRDACPPEFQGPEDVRRLCENTRLGDPSDPLGSMPITDPLTGMTYKNYHCALCDDRGGDDMVLWTPRLECPLLTLFNRSRNITDEWVVQNLATDGKNWGLFLDGENGSLFFHDCDVDPVMPRLLEAKIRPCRANLVSVCSPDWEDDEEVKRMCRAYMGPRYVHGGEGYRNVHCAVCNRVPNVTHLSCQSAELRGIDIFRHFGSHSFALLLDVNEARGQRVGQVRLCEGEGDVFDPFFKRCRSLSCMPGSVLRGRRCHRSTPVELKFTPNGNDTGNVTYEPDLSLSSGKSYNVSSGSRFLDCLLISLDNEDYVSLPNGTLFVPKYDRLYEPTSYLASDGSVLVCSPFAEDHGAKFLPVLGHVTVTGLGLSMLFLMLHFAVFLTVPDLRNLSGKNLASQCAALFLAYSCFIAGQFEALAGAACSLVAFLTFYFFLAAFFWMAAMAYDVWRTLRMATTELRVSSGRQTKRFIAYSFFAWAAPLLAVAALASAEYTDLFPVEYRPGFAKPPCWFTRRRSLLVFFAAPLLAIMAANALLFIASARMIVMTGQTAAPQGVQRRNFRLYLRLALLMGLTWVVGLVAGYADVPFLFYLFVVLNTLQGLFVFVAFSCTSKVLAHLRNKFKLTQRPKEFKSSCSTAFSTKPTTLMIRNG